VDEVDRLMREAPHHFGRKVDVVIIFFHTALPGAFDHYAAKMDSLRADFPEVRFIYVTAGFMAASRSKDNKNAHAFSEKVRARYKGKVPLYDLGAGKEFDCKSNAHAALVEATEKFVAAYTKPHTCPASGQVTLAGRVQSCGKTAAHTAELMQQAVAKVKFTYLVGEEECNCPVKAGKLAKESGKEKLFVVGKEKTCCETTARLNLARAKYKAAIEAMVQAQAAAAKPKPAAGT
jgi:hypothetical protein